MSMYLLIIFGACIAGVLVCYAYRPQSAADCIERVLPTTLVCGALAGLLIAKLLHGGDGLVVSSIVTCALLPTAIEFVSLDFRSREAMDIIDHAPEVEHFLLAWFDHSDKTITLDMLRAASVNREIVLHTIDHIDDIGHLASADIYLTGSVSGSGYGSGQGMFVLESYEITRADITGDEERASYRIRANQKYSKWVPLTR